MVTIKVKNAFNSTSWPRIIKAYLIRLICTLKTEEMDMTCGVPQGSVLVSTVWNVFYDDIFREEISDVRISMSVVAWMLGLY